MRRGCLFGLFGLLVLCVVCVGLGYFVAIPRVRDTARDGIRDAVSTEVARQIPARAGNAAPGAYTISAQELQDSLLANLGDARVNDVVIRITPTGMVLGVTSEGGQETTYTGVPTAVGGRLVMTDMDTSSDFLNFLFPADDLGDAIEAAVNGYLAQNGLTLESLDLGDGELTLNTAAA